MRDVAYLLSKSTLSLDGCRLWTGATFGDGGYGVAHIGRKPMGAHRLAYMIYHGIELQRFDFVCHKCDNKRCISRAHLFLGTPADNTADMVRKGRHCYGERHGNALLTEEAVRDILSTPPTYGSGRMLARKYGVAPSTISAVRTGYSWNSNNT